MSEVELHSPSTPFSAKIVSVDLDAVGDPIFKINFQTELPLYSKKNFEKVERSWDDFQRFVAYLKENYPHLMLPPLPSQKWSLRGLGTEEKQFLNSNLELFLVRIATHPCLQKDQGVKLFVEQAFAFSTPNDTRQRRLSGLRIAMSNIRIRMATPQQDSNPAFSDFRNRIDFLQKQYITTEKLTQKLTFHMEGIAKSYSDIGVKFYGMSVDDNFISMKSKLKELSTGLDNISENTSKQATRLDSLINGFFSDFTLRLHQSAQGALDDRMRVLADYDDIIKNTFKKKQQLEKMKASSGSQKSKIDAAFKELEEQTETEQKMKEVVKVNDTSMMKEIDCFESYRVSDISKLIRVIAQTQLDTGKLLTTELWNTLKNFQNPPTETSTQSQ